MKIYRLTLSIIALLFFFQTVNAQTAHKFDVLYGASSGSDGMEEAVAIAG